VSNVTALDLPMLDPLPERMEKYFAICQDKLGLIPNVLQAYAFDEDKLNAFSALYNDVMLAESGLTKLEQHRDELRKVGFTDRDIWDIAATAGFYNMTNRMASAVDMRPNDEYHAAHR